jgi:hypothetical protein
MMGGLEIEIVYESEKVGKIRSSNRMPVHSLYSA